MTISLIPQCFWSSYVIQMLLLLLASFSDQGVAVHEAAECAARAMMTQLNSGVKLVLPSHIKVNIVNFNFFSPLLKMWNSCRDNFYLATLVSTFTLLKLDFMFF